MYIRFDHGKVTRYYGIPSDASAPASHGHWPWWLMGSLLRAVVHVRAVEALLAVARREGGREPRRGVVFGCIHTPLALAARRISLSALGQVFA